MGSRTDSSPFVQDISGVSYIMLVRKGGGGQLWHNNGPPSSLLIVLKVIALNFLIVNKVSSMTAFLIVKGWVGYG